MHINLSSKEPQNIKNALALLQNLLDRMDFVDKSGSWKLPGNLTGNEIRALKLVYNLAAEQVKEPII